MVRLNTSNVHYFLPALNIQNNIHFLVTGRITAERRY